MNFRIYVKLPEKKRWYAISGGDITTKLIYAEMWNDKEIADKACESLIKTNPDLKFEVRAA